MLSVLQGATVRVTAKFTQEPDEVTAVAVLDGAPVVHLTPVRVSALTYLVRFTPTTPGQWVVRVHGHDDDEAGAEQITILVRKAAQP